MMIFPCGYHHVAAHSHHREPLANARPENHGIYNVTGNCWSLNKNIAIIIATRPEQSEIFVLRARQWCVENSKPQL